MLIKILCCILILYIKSMLVFSPSYYSKSNCFDHPYVYFFFIFWFLHAPVLLYIVFYFLTNISSSFLHAEMNQLFCTTACFFYSHKPALCLWVWYKYIMYMWPDCEGHNWLPVQCLSQLLSDTKQMYKKTTHAHLCKTNTHIWTAKRASELWLRWRILWRPKLQDIIFLNVDDLTFQTQI